MVLTRKYQRKKRSKLFKELLYIIILQRAAELETFKVGGQKRLEFKVIVGSTFGQPGLDPWMIES